jgi:hypothetical protein
MKVSRYRFSGHKFVSLFNLLTLLSRYIPILVLNHQATSTWSQFFDPYKLYNHSNPAKIIKSKNAPFDVLDDK